MQKYFDNVTNRSGDAVVNAQVTVTVTATGSLATIYADNGVTTKSNPMVVDSNGYFEFYAANGRYTLTVTGGALTTRVVQDVLLEDITGTGASLVGFSHSDTNPAGSIGAKAHQVVSVTDAPYSAKGDGVTDDTAAIQAAVNASLVVNFPDTGSTYKTRQVTLRAGSTLRGPGRLSLSSGVCILDVPLGANGVTIDGIGLSFQDATFGQGVIQIGITGSVAGSTTNDVTVRNCSITGKIWARRVLRPVIENNIIVNGGVHFDDWSDQAIVSGNTITQDLTYSNDAIGANNVDAAPAPHGQNVITNNVITTTRMGVEWRDWVVSGTTTNNDVKSIIAGNSIRTIGTDVSAFGISLNSDGWSISNNTINHDGAITSGTFGMEIVQSSYNTIVGNRVSGFSSGITVYSTTATNPAKGNVVADNTIRGCSFGIGVWRHTRDTRVHGNYVEFATGASARYAFQIDGDSTATDGTLGTHGERAIVTGNTVVADTSADANSYSYMYFAHMLDSICKDNTVLMTSGNAFSRGIFVIDCDSLSVEGNKLVGSGGVACQGIVLWQVCGRRVKVLNNTFSNLSKGLENSGGNPFYNVHVSGNTDNNCAASSRVFPSSFSSSSNGFKTAFATASPTLGTWVAGDVIFNMGAAAGWKCSAVGTAGTLPAVTGSVTSGTSLVSVSTLENIEEGTYLAIAGVGGTKRVTSIDRVGRTVSIDVAAGATVSGAAVSYAAPTFAALPF